MFLETKQPGKKKPGESKCMNHSLHEALNVELQSLSDNAEEQEIKILAKIRHKYDLRHRATQFNNFQFTKKSSNTVLEHSIIKALLAANISSVRDFGSGDQVKLNYFVPIETG